MPRYLIKVSPSTDLYMLWSTVVDNVIEVMTRQEVEAEGIAPELVRRADETGTSGRNGVGGWNRPYLTVAQTEVRDVADEFFRLNRADFEQYALLVREDRVAEAEALLVVPDHATQ